MSKKNVVYKVVGNKNRMGSNMNMYLAKKNISFTKFKKSKKIFWNKVKQFFPKYSNGSVIKSVEGSVGIMCFKTKKVANNFINQYEYAFPKSGVKIIKVLGCGKEINNYKFISGCGNICHFNFSDIIIKLKCARSNNKVGWIAYDSVVVLE